MPFCPECGKSVAPNAKFCRNCGASQVEESAAAVPAAPPAAPVAAPATPPVTPEAAPAPVKAKAEPKKTKSKTKSEPKPEPVPEPEPRRACSSCGTPVGPGENVCGACAAAAAEPDVPEPEEPVVIPPVQPAAPAPSNTCASCGSPLAGNEKFCGICGTVVSVATHAQQAIDSVAASFSTIPTTPTSPPPPPPAYTAPGQTADRTCRACGNIIKPGDKFCGKCCAKVVDDQSAAQYSAPASTVSPPPPVFSPAPGSPPTDQSGLRTCRACGNVIKPGDKFCSKCLVRVVDNQPAAAQYSAPVSTVSPPPPPPAFIPAPVPTPADQSGTRTCRACGNVIKPGDKFCSKCLVRVTDNLPSAATASVSPPPPPPVFTPAPAPVAADQYGTRTCRACGNVIKPGDKFCSKCLVRVTDNQPPATTASVSSPPPPPVFTPASAPSAVCHSCGSPINGPEKFCGICGAAVVCAPPPAPVPQPAGKFCGSCGASVSETTRFCGSCGAPTIPGPATAPAPAAQPSVTPGFVSPSGETVMGVIGNAKKMKMLGASWDTFNIIVTDQRMILAQMTQEMINTAIREAQAASKAEGKGYLSQMMHQMSAMFQYGQRYFAMSPDQALAENPANRGIGNRSITAIKMKLQTSGSEGEYREFKMLIEAPEGKFEFVIAEDDRFTTLLKQVYGDKVHMPFGYISTGLLRIKLF